MADQSKPGSLDEGKLKELITAKIPFGIATKNKDLNNAMINNKTFQSFNQDMVNHHGMSEDETGVGSSKFMMPVI